MIVEEPHAMSADTSFPLALKNHENSSTSASCCDGREPVSLPLHLHNKLYGRDNEMELLTAAYERSLQVTPTIASTDMDKSEESLHNVTTSNPNHPKEISHRKSSCVLITGASGLGKTALARTLEARVKADNGWFLYGKCNQRQTSHRLVASRPYAPFAEALTKFVDDLLLTPSENNNNDDGSVRDRLKNAILFATKDTSVNVLTDAIPALKKVLANGNTQSTDELQQSAKLTASSSTATTCTSSCTSITSKATTTVGGTGSRTDADIPSIVVICKFLKAFCSVKAPIALLVDDMQWLDTSSLRLFKALVLEQGQIPGLFIMGTCRGNEVSYYDPLAELLRTVEDRDGVEIQDIAVHPLPLDALQNLIGDLMPSLPVDGMEQVAELVLRQTAGNAFFAFQFLRNLCDTQELRYDCAQRQWTYNNKSPIEESKGEGRRDSSNIRDSTVDCTTFCSGTLVNLINQQNNPADLQQVLMVASCLGTEFSLSQIVAAAALDSTESLDKILRLLEEKGMLIRRQDKNTHGFADHWSGTKRQKVAFRWAHDRFEHISYSLIPESSRGDFHVSVGLNLLRWLSPFELQQQPFIVMHQFCCDHNNCPSSDTLSTTGLASIPFRSDGEKIQLAALCLAAGQQAALSSAFQEAEIYLQLGLKVMGPLPAKAFAAHYDLTLNLFNAAAEMECFLGNFDQVDELVAAVSEHAKSFRDTLQTSETQIYSFGSRQDLDGAIHLGLQVLRNLGESFPRKPGLLSVLPSVYKTKKRLEKKSADDIVNMKPLQDWKKYAALRIIHLMIPHANRAEVYLTVLLATRGIEITLGYGLSEMACVGFFSFGMLLCNPLGYVEEGIRVVEMSSAVQEALDAKPMKCRVDLVLWAFSRCLRAPIQQSIQPLRDASRAGFLSGDIEMACLCLYCSSCASFLSGASTLDAIEQELADLNNRFSQRHQETLLFYLRISQQVVQNLREPAGPRSLLYGDFFDEQTGLAQAREVGDVPGATLVYLFQSFLAVYFNELLLVRRPSQMLQKSSLQGLNSPLLIQAIFIGGLAEVMGATGRMGARQAGKASLKRLKKFSCHSPANVLNKVYLIEAERLAARGQQKESLEKYRLSIASARENNLLHEEALACERAGRALNGWGQTELASEFLEEACCLYGKWGSVAKVSQLASAPFEPLRRMP